MSFDFLGVLIVAAVLIFGVIFLIYKPLKNERLLMAVFGVELTLIGGIISVNKVFYEEINIFLSISLILVGFIACIIAMVKNNTK
ncbi:hypothetical protein [Paenibacillus chitinolyticus]|uniref:hypothetical protein n=1 Tax=Paenibacillus chitinolyticus TaxID=79263 RepID=UPI003D07A0F3